MDTLTVPECPISPRAVKRMKDVFFVSVFLSGGEKTHIRSKVEKNTFLKWISMFSKMQEEDWNIILVSTHHMGSIQHTHTHYLHTNDGDNRFPIIYLWLALNDHSCQWVVKHKQTRTFDWLWIIHTYQKRKPNCFYKLKTSTRLVARLHLCFNFYRNNHILAYKYTVFVLVYA